MKERREMIESSGCDLSVRRQCALLGIARSGLYHEAKGVGEKDQRIMRMLDEQYTKMPYYGVERMTAWLHREGEKIGHNKVRRLMREMGLEAICPKRRLSIPDKENVIYPYLLRGVSVSRPNQVWATDITYIRLSGGFVYLVAIMDWFSRYVLSWRVSTALDTEFCKAALEEALVKERPEIFNSDQGSQFTSREFTGVLKAANVRISMDGRGRVFDNIFVERLWRSVKYEEVYIKDYRDVRTARNELAIYFRRYNTERLHQSLDYQTPLEVYRG